MRNPFNENESILPDDAEDYDRREIKKIVEHYFEKTYPNFEPQVIVWNEKEYWLPALKVLSYYKGKFTSPSNYAVWDNMELRAECSKTKVLVSLAPDPFKEHIKSHESPSEDCVCGIYGSVNVEEIYDYLYRHFVSNSTMRTWRITPTFTLIDGFDVDDIRAYTKPPINDEPKNVLCIIEPFPDAKVIRTRKGWKASHAFISEILPDTMRLDEARGLLSIAWNRDIDVRSLYENR